MMMRSSLRRLIDSARVYVFDLDDTLYPEAEFALSGYAAAEAIWERHGGSAGFSAACRRRFEDGQRLRIFNDVVAELGGVNQDSIVDLLVDAYRFHEPSIKLSERTRKNLHRLRSSKRLALITDGAPRTQTNKLRALKASALFHALVLTGRYGSRYGKPHPRAFRFLETRFRCRGRSMVYIADNPTKDFVAPNRLGWWTVRIRSARGIYAHLPDSPAARPDFVFSDLGGFLNSIRCDA
jgi:putative hydrolase of the HAD superfamily